jgi:hypothetical protein
MLSFPSAVYRITTATMPLAKKITGGHAKHPLFPDSKLCLKAVSALQMRKMGDLILGLVPNKITDPAVDVQTYSSQMSSIFLTAGDARALTRGLFGILVPDYLPNDGAIQNGESRELLARAYYRQQLVLPLAEILQGQKGHDINALVATRVQEEISIGRNLVMKILVGGDIPMVLRPIAKAWVKIETSFACYGGADAAFDIQKQTTPTEEFYKPLFQRSQRYF